MRSHAGTRAHSQVNTASQRRRPGGKDGPSDGPASAGTQAYQAAQAQMINA